VVISKKITYHQKLASFFSGKTLYLDEPINHIPNTRKLVEQPFQQTKGEKWDTLGVTLTSLLFIEAKCAAGMTYNLITDFKFCLDSLPDAKNMRQEELFWKNRLKIYIDDLISFSKKEIPVLYIISSSETEKENLKDTVSQDEVNTLSERLHSFSLFVSQECNGLLKYSASKGFTIQQAYNSAISGYVAKAAEELIEMNTSSNVLLLHEKSMRPDHNINPAEIATLAGHEEEVKCVCISADGETAVSGSSDQTIRIWNIERGECLKTIQGKLGWIKCLALTADGKIAASGSTDGTVRLWNTENGECLRILSGHSGAITALAISADGQMAVSGSYDNTLRIWDLNAGKCLYILQAQTVTGVSMTADKRTIISAGSDDTIRIWDAGKGNCIKVIPAVDNYLTSIAITPCGSYAVSGGQDKMLRYWDLSAGILLREFPGHEYHVTSVQISADGKIALSGSNDNSIKVWNTENGECIKTYKGHTNLVTCVSMTPDSKLVVSAGDNRIRVWNRFGKVNSNEKGKHKYDVDKTIISADGRTVISGSWDRISRWDMENGAFSGEYKGHTDSIMDVHISSDSNSVISTSSDETLRIWDLQNGDCQKTVELHDVTVFNFEVTPDAARVVAPSTHGFPQFVSSIVLLDVKKGKLLKKFRDHRDKVECLCITPDGRFAVSGSSDQKIRVWDLEKRRCIKTLSGHTGAVQALCIAPDSRTVISSSEDNTIRIWDLNTGVCLNIIKGFEIIKRITITPDARKIVFGDNDKSIKVLDLQTGYLVYDLQGHEDSVINIAITPDGKRIISYAGIYDPTLRVWDIQNGESLCVYLSKANISSISKILPDGRFVYGSTSGEVIITNPHNLPLDLPVITAVRLWHYGKGGILRQSGHWEDAISARCPWCGSDFPVEPSILKSIQAVSSNSVFHSTKASCMELSSEAWEDTQLKSECPHCHKALQFNPFVADNQNSIITR
jgi:WD40 repeat protein